MSADELTLAVLAERILTHFDSKKLVDWAVNMLQLGYESENLFVLAGLDHESTVDREKYFWKSIEDLNIDIEKTDNELIYSYALTVANWAIKKEITVGHAFSLMLKIVYASDYDYRYISFFEISEDLEYMKYDNTFWINSGLTAENSEEFIMTEFKIFTEMEPLGIPQEERGKSYCEQCKKLNTPLTKTKYQLRKPFTYLAWGCGFCKSEKLIFSNNHEVKWMIIESFQNPAAHL